jgi:hypothetical protein
MSIRNEAKLYQDYVLVVPSIWQKLIGFYGGAPNIILQILDKPVRKLEVPEMP